MPKRILVVGRNVPDLLPLLRQFPVEVFTDETRWQEADIIISHGGDGALLGAERKFPGIPKCPIRDDAMNPKCPAHSIKNILNQLFKGELECSHLDTLQAEFNGQHLTAINDLVITRELGSGAIRYRITTDEALVRSMVIADGLVISTSFGSTGYFQSITGGNFTSGIGLAYNNAVDGIRFGIIAPPKLLEIKILRGPATVVADNDPNMIHLETGNVLRVSLAPHHTLAYGIDVLRCHTCFELRHNAIRNDIADNTLQGE